MDWIGEHQIWCGTSLLGGMEWMEYLSWKVWCSKTTWFLDSYFDFNHLNMEVLMIAMKVQVRRRRWREIKNEVLHCWWILPYWVHWNRDCSMCNWCNCLLLSQCQGHRCNYQKTCSRSQCQLYDQRGNGYGPFVTNAFLFPNCQMAVWTFKFNNKNTISVRFNAHHRGLAGTNLAKNGFLCLKQLNTVIHFKQKKLSKRR